MAQFSVLLFDLGGVLVENAVFDDLPKLYSGPPPEGDLHDLWLNCEVLQSFDRGHVSADDFAARFVTEWRLTLTPAAFLERFAGWPKGFFPGAAALLTRLRTHYRIAYLSNSNAVHWGRLADVLAHADLAISSHLCGLVKPDPAIFQHALRELGCAAGDVCFFDDSPRNVAAARTVGMAAHLTPGFDALAATLRELGLDRVAEAGAT